MIIRIFMVVGILGIVLSLACLIAFDRKMNVCTRYKDHEQMNEAFERFTVSLISFLGFLSLTIILTIFM